MPFKFTHFLAAALLVAHMSLSAQRKAEPVKTNKLESSIFNGFSFRSIGPAFMSGRVADLAIHPENENLWYVAVGSGGVWKTENAGTTWQPIFDAQTPLPKEDVSGDITIEKRFTADKVWVLNGLVAVKNNATLIIEPGTTVLGAAGTGANTAVLIVDKGAKIDANGTAEEPIIFRSETAYDGGANTWGQWGGITLIGKAGNSQVTAYEANSAFTADSTDMADNSGVLRYVKVYNSGITMEENKEINGISFVGVGSGTTVDNIVVEKSDDDCIELWGGSVNLSNISLAECTDDHFDIDDGYSGTVTNLTINQTNGNAAMEMSGTTAATFKGLNITVNNSAKEGGIFFKGNLIGGHFENATVTYNVSNGFGAIHSDGSFDSANTTFAKTRIDGNTSIGHFTGTSAAAIENIFDNQ